MENSSKIFGLWAISCAIIVCSIIAATAAITSQEKKSVQIIDQFNKFEPEILTETERKTQILGRQIIAQLYDAPELTQGVVLGDQISIPLNQEEIADISTPTVVRIINQVAGDVSFEEFDIDFYQGQLVPNGKIYSEKLSATATGTGFFVDNQGHILTNSHVIDKRIILDKFISQVLFYYGGVVEEQLGSLSDAEAEELRDILIERYGGDPFEAAFQLGLDIGSSVEAYIYENGSVNSSQTLTVVDPKQTKSIVETEEQFDELIKQGIKARIVDWRANYRTSQEDVALIKIEQTPTPFLNLNPNPVNTGQQIYVIGFPSNAEINTSDLFQKTMTQGNINAIKDLENIRVYQFDAKISQGSSGSPLLNEDAEVVGIVSFLTDGLVGDSFAFAIPIEHAVDLMKANGINPGDNPYFASFTAGIDLAKQDLCRKANEQFEQTKTQNQVSNQESLQKRINDCSATIAAGQSKDGTWYQAQELFYKVPGYAWGGAAALILISGAAIFLLRRNRLQQTEGTIIPTQPTAA